MAIGGHGMGDWHHFWIYSLRKARPARLANPAVDRNDASAVFLYYWPPRRNPRSLPADLLVRGTPETGSPTSFHRTSPPEACFGGFSGPDRMGNIPWVGAFVVGACNWQYPSMSSVELHCRPESVVRSGQPCAEPHQERVFSCSRGGSDKRSGSLPMAHFLKSDKDGTPCDTIGVSDRAVLSPSATAVNAAPDTPSAFGGESDDR